MIVTVYSNNNDIDWSATGADRIVQNVVNILRTRQHEVPFMSGMGINQDYIDTDTQQMKARFLSHVREVITAYESRAKVVDVRIDSCNDDGEYVIAVDLEV